MGMGAGAGMGVYGVIGVIGIVVGLVKEIALLVLFIQGIRLVNFIIRNKGLSRITPEGVQRLEREEAHDGFEDLD